MYSNSVVPRLTAKMSILLWITTEKEYKIISVKNVYLQRVIKNSIVMG